MKLTPHTTLTNIGKQSAKVRYIDAKDEATGLRASGFDITAARGGFRFRGDAHDIVVSDGIARGAGVQESPNLPAGIDCDGTAHDIIFRNIESCGHQMRDVGGYTNGDGFKNERGNYRITYDGCYSHDNSDGGFDLKGKDNTLTNSRAERNHRNFRIHGSGTLTDCTSGVADDGIWIGALTGDVTITNHTWIGKQTHIRIDGGSGHNLHIVGGIVDGKPVESLVALKIASAVKGAATITWEPAPVASPLPARNEAMAFGPIALATKLNDSDGDGKIVSSGKIAALGPKGTTWIFKPDLPAFTYWPQGYSEPVTAPPEPVPAPPAPPLVVTPPAPPPVVTPPVYTATLINNEVFILAKGIAVGLNAGCGIGTLGNAPAGFPTDAKAGYLRAGLVTVPQVGGDEVLEGTPVDGFGVAFTIAGKAGKVVNVPRGGITNLPGAWTNDGSLKWVGTGAQLKVEQTVSVNEEGDTLIYEGLVTNVSNTDMTNAMFGPVNDPDQGDGFNTVNTVIETATVRAVASGIAFEMATDDGDAYASILAMPKGAFISDPYAVPAKAKGFAASGDYTVHLVFRLGDLKAGQASRRFRYSKRLAVI